MSDLQRDIGVGAISGAGIGLGGGVKDYLLTKGIFDGINTEVAENLTKAKSRGGLAGFALKRMFKGKLPTEPLGKFPRAKFLKASIGTGALVGIPAAVAITLALRMSRRQRNKMRKTASLRRALGMLKTAQAAANPYAPKGGSALPWVNKPKGPSVPAWSSNPASKAAPDAPRWKKAPLPSPAKSTT